ncbi:MAG: alkaline phosphatase family protein [Anaerolineae bacterium]|nr:alkaline phosphatase family protein [Anaerolineae bacterium]
MNVIVRTLVDLYEALVRWYHSWRYGPVARRLGKTDGAGHGLIVVQIDGLSHDELLRALSGGHMPYLAQVLRAGEGEAYRWFSGLPSTTPAVQAALMYGTKHGIPGFRWYEKSTGAYPVCKLPGFVNRLQARLSAGRTGILRGGSSYANMFDGDASTSLFTLAAIGGSSLLQRAGVLPLFIILASSPLRVARIAALSVWTYLSELWRRVSAFFWPSKFGRLSLLSPFIHVLTDVLVREISTFAALVEIHRGVPAIYVNYTSYDEWAHRFGPDDGHALRALRAIDGQLKQLDRMRRWGGRPYDLYVLSDHGMTACVPFDTAFGQTLGEFIDGCIEGSTRTDEAIMGPVDLQEPAALLGYETEAVEDDLDGLSREVARSLRESLEKRVEAEPPEPAVRSDVVVRDSGPLSHVYFNAVADRPATLEELSEFYPGLVRRVAGHPGIAVVAVRSPDGPVLVTAAGVFPAVRESAAAVFTGLVEATELLDEVVRLLEFSNSGDLVVLGRWGWWGRPDQVVSFERQRGTHGGAGGHQCDAFVVAFTAPSISLDGVRTASDLYRLFLSYQSEPLAVETEGVVTDTASAPVEAVPTRRQPQR